MQKTAKKQPKKAQRSARIPIRIAGGIAVVIIVAAGVWFGVQRAQSVSHSPVQLITVSTLEKIIQVSELSTSTVVYNGIAEVPEADDPDSIAYYVSYEATVQAGIDLTAVEVQEVDHEAKTITISLPEVQLFDANVDISSLDYIFLNDKANTATVSAEAYKACQEDVNAESEKQSQILDLAHQNAENIVKALVEPFVEQIDGEYDINIA